MNEFFQKVISKQFGESTQLISSSPVSGGCINNTYRLQTSKADVFLKWNTDQYQHMFECEAKGLETLASNSILDTPEVFNHGIEGKKSFLLLAWLEKGPPCSAFWESFGSGLARLHKVSSDTFGFDEDNYIGKLPQRNKNHDSWHDFFREERLKPQISFAKSRNLLDSSVERKFEILYDQLENLIPKEAPSLIHGDLWSGNFIINSSGSVAIFDPAVYYGHRETEIAFTHLFGGFSSNFYSFYNEEFPLESGFEDRVDIHNLYPLLVHVNLFGTSYLSGILQTLRRFT